MLIKKTTFLVVFFINCYVQPRQDLNLRGFGGKVPPGRRGDRPHKISFAKQNSGAARGAEPLWKSAAADLGSIRRPWSSTAHVFALLPEDDNGAFFMPKSGVFEVFNCKEVILL